MRRGLLRGSRAGEAAAQPGGLAVDVHVDRRRHALFDALLGRAAPADPLTADPEEACRSAAAQARHDARVGIRPELVESFCTAPVRLQFGGREHRFRVLTVEVLRRSELEVVVLRLVFASQEDAHDGRDLACAAALDALLPAVARNYDLVADGELCGAEPVHATPSSRRACAAASRCTPSCPGPRPRGRARAGRRCGRGGSPRRPAR
jgi:hypothetical protein